MKKLLLAVGVVALALTVGTVRAAALPKAIELPAPVYPQGEKIKADSKVTIEFKVDDSGHVDYAKITQSSGSDPFDAAALESVMAYRFEPPAYKSNTDRPTYTKVIEFNQTNAGQTAQQPDSYYQSKYDTEARIVKTVPLEYPIESRKKWEEGDVITSLQLEADGKVHSVKVERSSGHPLLDDAALATVQQYEYSPASLQGKNLPSTKLVKVTFKLKKDEDDLKLMEMANTYALCGDRLNKPDSRADITQLIEQTGAQQASEQLVGYMTQQLDAAIAEKMEPALRKTSAPQRQKATETITLYRNKVLGLFSWQKLEPVYAKAYCDTYSEQEVKDLLTFFRGPTGQMMRKKESFLRANVEAQQQYLPATIDQYIAEALQEIEASMAKTHQ